MRAALVFVLPAQAPTPKEASHFWLSTPRVREWLSRDERGTQCGAEDVLCTGEDSRTLRCDQLFRAEDGETIGIMSMCGATPRATA